MLNIIEINNFNAPELDVYARYTEAQLLNKDRPEDGLFIAESPKVIGRALDAGYIPISVLVEKKQMEENEETSQIMNRFDDTKVSIFTADSCTACSICRLSCIRRFSPSPASRGGAPTGSRSWPPATASCARPTAPCSSRRRTSLWTHGHKKRENAMHRRSPVLVTCSSSSPDFASGSRCSAIRSCSFCSACS